MSYTYGTMVGAPWVESSSGSVYDPIRGGQVVKEYQGSATEISALANGLQNYERFELDGSEAPLWKLRVYSPEVAEAPVYELLANLVEKDMTEHEAFSTVTTDEITKIEKFMRNPVEGALPLVGALGLELFNLLWKKHTKYFTEQYVLRYSVTVTNAISLNMAYSHVDELHTITQVGNSITGGLPAGIVASVGNIPERSTSESGFSWAWLKRPPTSRQMTIGKVVISGEWWLDLWPTRIYPLWHT